MKTPSGAVISCRLPLLEDELKYKELEKEADKNKLVRKKSFESFLAESKCYYYASYYI